MSINLPCLHSIHSQRLTCTGFSAKCSHTTDVPRPGMREASLSYLIPHIFGAGLVPAALRPLRAWVSHTHEFRMTAKSSQIDEWARSETIQHARSTHMHVTVRFAFRRLRRRRGTFPVSAVTWFSHVVQSAALAGACRTITQTRRPSVH